MLKDYMSAIESRERALNIGQKVLGEDHRTTLTATMGWGCLNVSLKITCEPLSHTSEY